MGLLFFAILVILSGIAKSATVFEIYSCPLSSSSSILSSSSNKNCHSSSRRSNTLDESQDIPYGIAHTYVQIGGICYDWGNWNYPRQLSCNHQDISCCVRLGTLEYRGYTSCADRVGDFESAWSSQGRKYALFTWNCQDYSDAMKDFLNNCNINSVSAFG